MNDASNNDHAAACYCDICGETSPAKTYTTRKVRRTSNQGIHGRVRYTKIETRCELCVMDLG